MLEFIVPGLIIATIGVGAVCLCTKRGSRARIWITATPNRIAGLGMLIAAFLWTGVAIYNESTRDDFAPRRSIQPTPGGAADR